MTSIVSSQSTIQKRLFQTKKNLSWEIIENNYRKQKQIHIQVTVENKIPFLEWIGNNITNYHYVIRYANEFSVFKKIASDIHKFDEAYLSELINNGELKHYTLICFLKDIGYDGLIELYKERVVEPLCMIASRMVLKIAKQYNLKMPFEDKVMLGVEGLVEAAWRFEPDKGYKFITYAQNWIKQRMFAYIKSEVPLSIAGNQLKKFHEILPYWQQFKKENEHGDVDEFIVWLEQNNLINKIALDRDTIIMILNAINPTYMYEFVPDDMEGRTVDDYLDSELALADRQTDIEKQVEEKEYIEKFMEVAGNVLTKIEKAIFFMKVFQNMSYDEISQKTGLAKRAIQSYYLRACQKLRQLFQNPQNIFTLQIPNNQIQSNQVNSSIVDNLL